MIKPVQALENAADRLVQSFFSVAKKVSEFSSGDHVREAANEWSGADRNSARDVLTGNDVFTGESRSFAVGDVESVPLADSAGKLIGVKFPSQDDDGKHWVEWARAYQRISDRFYSTSELVTTETGWDLPDKRPAPWDSGEHGAAPTYVFAHGIHGSVTVRIRAGAGETSDVRVDGRGFGRIVASDRFYRRAIVENSSTTVSAVCYGDSVAEEMTSELWEAGIDTDVYAFRTATSDKTIKDEELILAAALSAIAREPEEEALLGDPIRHYARPAGDV